MTEASSISARSSLIYNLIIMLYSLMHRVKMQQANRLTPTNYPLARAV